MFGCNVVWKIGEFKVYSYHSISGLLGDIYL